MEKEYMYWNPYLETLPREKLLKAELKNFRKYLQYAKDHSPMYRERYRDIEPGDIRTRDDLRLLPLIDKEDLRRAQVGTGLNIYGLTLGVDPEHVTTFRQTSGTTGIPVYVPESYESWQWRVEVWCHILWMAGFRETDRVFVPFGYNVYVAFWEGHYAAEKLGCEVVPGGALDTKGRINKMMEVKATALLNTPTYGLHMAEDAVNMGLDPKKIGIRRMQCAGEPMPQPTRKRLEELWGAEVYDHIGGTEPCAWAAMCQERTGLHIIEPFFLVEILDMETMSREVNEGELGVAVVTPLGRRSFPLVRFNTKDIVRRGRQGCPCGRTSMMIAEVVGRADELRKIRGVLFTPVSVEELLRAEFPEIREFEIIVEKKGVMDEVSLRVEPCEKMEKEAMKNLSVRIVERLKMKTNLRFNIIPVLTGELPRYTLKSKRFKDLRGT
ncbi:MAG: AMP-binding protein [Deltaproteobacteria bacterium]|nr:AMP-binding protein [Deltaproteobacteria bacterium]